MCVCVSLDVHNVLRIAMIPFSIWSNESSEDARNESFIK